MRIRVIGTSDSAIAVRGMLNQDPTVAVSEVGYLHTIEIVPAECDIPTVDGVDSELERLMVNRISSVAKTNILLLRAEGIQSDQHIRIGVPEGPSQHLVERGIFQAVLQMVNHNPYIDRGVSAPVMAPAVPVSIDTSHVDARVTAAREEAAKAEARAERARADVARASEEARAVAEARAKTALEDARKAEERALAAKTETVNSLNALESAKAATVHEMARLTALREEAEKLFSIPTVPPPIVEVAPPTFMEKVKAWFA